MNKLDQLKMTAFVRLFTFLKLPLLNWVRPSIIELNDEIAILKIPLGRRTKNHLGTMYFGALSMGGEGVVAATAVDEIRKSKKRIDFVFKEFHAEFLKRAEGDVHFICEEPTRVRELVLKAVESKERETEVFRSYAIVPAKSPSEIVAEFKVALSLKYRPSK